MPTFVDRDWKIKLEMGQTNTIPISQADRLVNPPQRDWGTLPQGGTQQLYANYSRAEQALSKALDRIDAQYPNLPKEAKRQLYESTPEYQQFQSLYPQQQQALQREMNTGMDILSGIIPGADIPYRWGERTLGESAKQAALSFLPFGIGKAGKVVKGVGKVVEKVVPEITNPTVKKLIDSMKLAKRFGRTTKVLRKEELSKRLARAEEAFQKGGGTPDALQASLKELKGGMPTAENIFANVFTPENVKELRTMVAVDEKLGYFGRVHLDTALITLGMGNLQDLRPFEIKALGKFFGDDFARGLENPATRDQWEKIASVLNIPRAVMASGDLSGWLRQGGMLVARHPTIGMEAFVPMVKAFASEKGANLADDFVRGLSRFQEGVEYGLYYAPLPGMPGGKLLHHEEMFQTTLGKYIPLVKQSERAFVTVLNQLRFRTWEHTLNHWDKLGVKYVEKDLQDLARLVNASSGRGSLPKSLAGAGPLLNALFFSPRLQMAKIVDIPSLLFNPSTSKVVRVEAWRTVSQFLGVGTGILALAAASGVGTVETNPTSSDFGKLKIGNTRLDIWGGYVQYARFMARMIDEMHRRSQNKKPKDVTDLIWNLAQSKASPVPGLILDIARGKSYSGEEMKLETKSIGKQVWNRIMYLSVQDLVDATVIDGIRGFFAASPSIFGIGALTYKKKRGSGIPPMGYR